jgi:phospholipid-binding lipoprotein MlaA
MYDDTISFKANDPFEIVNRKVFDFNLMLHQKIISKRRINLFKLSNKKTQSEQKTKFFNAVKIGMFNFLNNLYGPSNTINFILQKNPEKSFQALWRFLINSSLGFGGFIDIAELFELKKERASFEQTLTKYGAKSGPYLVIPIIGAYSTRTLTADIFEIMTNPLFFLVKNKLVVFTIYNYNVISSYVDYYDLIFKNNIDTYARVRALYLQNKSF